MNGLLKAYLNEPIRGLIIPDRYTHKPERLGMTIAYGEMPDAYHLCGLEITLEIANIVQSQETMFATCLVSSGSLEGCDVKNFVKANRDLFDIHITLGWVEGSAPVSALAECRDFWSYKGDATHVTVNKVLRATIEWQDFAK